MHSQSRPSDRSQFNVGIICALPVEASAVQELFDDDQYDEYSTFYRKPENDPNSYFNGKMGKANVVLCLAPDSGTIAATGVMANMMVTYPQVKIVLIVGICGGLPSLKGERVERSLGDVIISDSMVVYDRGKQGDDKFYPKNQVYSHPASEASLLRTFEMKRPRANIERKLSEYLRQLQSDQEWMHPGVRDDPRQHQEQAGEDYTNSSWRKPVEYNNLSVTKLPKLHIGRMASANIVMKSEVHRDKLAGDHGVIGFEMEGAGVWSYKVPCIIVKGISDWADNRKNDDWHYYAAATGASAAKALIEYYMMSKIDSHEDKHWLVPFLPNKNFTGREREIEQVESLLLSPNGPTKVAISGLGGIGKTQIALELAYRAREWSREFPVIWIPCINLETLEQSYLNAARVVGLDTPSPEKAKEYLKEQLSSNLTKWLLILDSVDEAEVWAALKDALPHNRQGRVLITTRNQQVAVDAASSQIVPVDAPDSQTAIEMLSKYLVKKDLLKDEKATVELVDKLASLPLAIVQASSFLNKTRNITLSQYGALLDGQESRALELLSHEFKSDARYNHTLNSVAATWLVSFEQIEELNPLAAEYLKLMACVQYQDLPQGFLPDNEDMLEQVEALGLLSAFAFVNIHPETEYLSCHRLVHLVTRSWMRQKEEFVAYLDKAAGRMYKIYFRNKEETRRLQRDCLPHVLSLLSEKELSNDDEEPSGKNKLSGEEKRLWEKGRMRNEKEQKRADNFPLLYGVAHALFKESRNKEALIFFHEILRLRKRWIGRQNQSTLASRLELALAYQKLGHLEKAEKQAKKALEGYKEILGEEDLDTIDAVGALAHVYKLQERFAEAEELDRQMLDLLNRHHPVDALTSAQMLNMATMYEYLGRKKDAKAMNLKAREIAPETTTTDNLGTLASMMTQLSMPPSVAQLDEAKELFEKLVETDEPESEHPGIVAAGTGIVHLYLTLQQPKQAEDLATQVVEIATKTLGERNPDTIEAKSTLAKIYTQQGRLDEAGELMRKVLADQKETLEQSHIPISTTLYTLASIYSRQGRHLNAAMMKKEAIRVRVREDVLKPDDPQLMENMHAFARFNNDAGAKRDALDLMVKAVRLSKKFLGPVDPRTETYVAFLAELQGTEESSAIKTTRSKSESRSPERGRLRDRLSIRNLGEKVRRFARV
ncbi:uncharacterized protein BDV17DRAFT_207379 [Aspergillus undulatus]|uniref:uncharacterized protein n=1 Tax=Aspergillus undulatus TaxID=1810928 RepID=UPI003CCD5C47